VVLLGATAAQSLLGREFSVTRQRGRLVKSPVAPYVIATVHPSILRAPDNDSRRQQMQDFIRDLKAVAEIAEGEEAA
jgi:DNA polymerase